MKSWKLVFSSFLTVFLLVFFLPVINSENFSVIIDELPIGTPKNYSLNFTTEYLIQIGNISENFARVPPRIILECEECHRDQPLLIVVRQSRGVLSWELPVIIESKKHSTVYKETARTLCLYNTINDSLATIDNEKNKNANALYPVTLSLSTSSKVSVKVHLVVNLQENFLLDLNNSQTVRVMPSAPFFFMYEFPPEGETSILLRVTSDDETCMIVSIQNVSCPILDLEQNIQYRGQFQTITKQGGFTLTKEAFPNGFYIVLVVSGDDNYCYYQFLTREVERAKTVTLSLSKSISSSDYKIAILITLSVITVFWIMMFTVYYIKYIREKKIIENVACLIDEEEEATVSVSNQMPRCNSSPISPGPLAAETETLSVETDSSLDETDFDLVSDVEFDKNLFRLKGYLYLCDLARKNQIVLKKKSDMYFWNLLTVAIFYFLPVIQLVINNQYQLNQSGNEDLCYYNFLCSHPLWVFSDFNHIFSNIAYVFFGSLFMVLTALKERLHTMKVCKDHKLDRHFGIPQHFGLFYSMGAALIIEGIFSACYHVCPNRYNFQFDSSFMYVICTLCMIKIYQTRHPDINATAYATFFLLAGVIFIRMCGVLSNDLAFWIAFSILHLSTCAFISLQIYYMGRWKFEIAIIERFFREIQLCFECHWKFFVPTFPSRFLLLAVANAFNWALAIGSITFEFKNFSSYLLTIFMVNLMLYTTFYIIMKFICKEKLLSESIVYILLSVLGWSSALYFFFSKTISWRLIPAESKLYNQPCKLLNFYDYHDVWHFISAAAMFSSFMVLFTLDDDLEYVHRSKILVF